MLRPQQHSGPEVSWDSQLYHQVTVHLYTGSIKPVLLVFRLEISRSHLLCLDFHDLAGFDSISSISVTHSGLSHLLCSDPGQGRHHHHHDPVIRTLKHLISLDVSHNKLSSLDSSLASFSRLRHLNISHNRLRSLRPVFR